MTGGGEHRPPESAAEAFRLPGYTAGLPVQDSSPGTPDVGELAQHQRLADESPGEDVLRRALPGEPSPDQPEEREPLDERPAPRIYVASLSDYNEGNLHGVWVDAAQSLDDTWDEIQRMLMASSTPDAEEWAIHDYEGFGALSLGEYEPLEFLFEVAQGIVAHGEAFAAFVEVAERDRDRFPLFDQVYQGRWESVQAYVGELLESTGVDTTLAELPEWVRDYVQVDMSELARSLTASGVMTVAASEGGVYVFDLEA